jgi:AcrR family transcriptional regulator
MSPRPYRLGKREEAIGEGRRRILDAARELLRVSAAYPGFTVDAVARRADVARATVYYQFGSKTGLLEAVCDDLAEAGGMADLARVFTSPAPDAAIRDFITAFAGFWAADRVVMRRLRALAALDPDVGAVIAARDQRRREGLTVLVARLPAGTGPVAEQAVQMLYALTSFETFDTLAGPDRGLADALPLVTRLADAVRSMRIRELPG